MVKRVKFYVAYILLQFLKNETWVRGREVIFGGDKFMVLMIVMIVSQVHAYLQTQVVHNLNIYSFFYVNRISIKWFKNNR